MHLTRERQLWRRRYWKNVNTPIDKKVNKNNTSVNIKFNNIKENEKESEIFNFWNAQNIILHKDINTHLKAIQNALKEYSVDDIKKFIERYSKVIKSEDYYFKTKWTLTEFLKQKNAMPTFNDDGSKWVNFNNRNNFTTSQRTNSAQNFTPRTYNEDDLKNFFANLDEVKI